MQKEAILDLLNEMTIEEKIGQLVQLSGVFYLDDSEITGPLASYELTNENKYSVGSIIGVTTAENALKIQTEYLEQSRLRIPLLFMADIIHGVNTIYPVPIAMACSFNPKLIKEMATFSGVEAANTGVHVTFSPMADLARDARWGRNMETNGEDPYLNKILAENYVKGYQGSSLSPNSNLISCVKHFAGYGLVESGREYNYVDVSERVLHEFHYPAYQEAIKAGARMVMSSFNTINSIPVTVNQKIIKGDLRSNLNFKGVVISDWSAITEAIHHKLATDSKDCARLACEATIDIDMMSMAYQDNLVELVKSGEICEQQINQMVLRILHLKNDYGLFENPFKNLKGVKKHAVKSPDIIENTKKVAAESAILLKNNDSVLPLKTKFAIYGKFTETTDYFGPWSWQGDLKIVKSIKAVFSNNNDVIHVPYQGMNFDLQDFDSVETVVLFIGENAHESGEAKSKTNINLSKEEEEIIKTLKSSGKKVIAVIFSGRPLAITNVVQYLDAIIYAWFLGTSTAIVLHDIITGKINPSAKLAMSLPRTVGQCPIYYNNYATGRPKAAAIDSYVSKYIDCSNQPLYSFGHGLTYSNMKIKKVEITKSTYNLGEDIELRVWIQNPSEYAGMEVIQVYVNDLVASVIRPNKELKAFEKVYLNAGETKAFIINISAKELGYINENLEFSTDLGEFKIMVGLNSEELLINKIKVGD